jgi:MotA/TolQ/ExbB proton channel family
MWNAYWETVRVSPIDWFILTYGCLLVVAHIVGLVGRWRGRMVLFVQKLDRYRTVCLLLTELLPVFGLLGTVLALMNTFREFQADPGEAPDLTHMIQTLSPAMSATVSGLLLVGPNLVLNAILWLACPATKAEKD